jgi:hypothetical protein
LAKLLFDIADYYYIDYSSDRQNSAVVDLRLLDVENPNEDLEQQQQ